MNRQRILFGIMIAVLLVVNVIVTHEVMTVPNPGLADFMVPWEASRSYYIDGVNPYSDEAGLNIQNQIYGRPAQGSENLAYFAYPMYASVMIAPLVYIDYAWASAIFLVILEAMLVTAIFLILDVFSWKPPALIVTLLVLSTLIIYYPARGLILGQLGMVAYFFHILAIWALYKENQTLAGVALAISTLKPQMSYLIVPFLLLWAFRTQRWRFITVFSVSFLVLLGVSFLVLPTWINDWLYQVFLYPDYTNFNSPPVWIIFQKYLGLGDIVELIVTASGYIYMLWLWYGVIIQRKKERFMWTVAMTFTITHLIAFRTATPHFVTFSLPLIFYFKHMRRIWIYITLAVLFVIPWAQFVLTLQGDSEDQSMFLFAPIAMFIVLLFTRKMWWSEARDPIDHAPLLSEATNAEALQSS